MLHSFCMIHLSKAETHFQVITFLTNISFQIAEDILVKATVIFYFVFSF